MLEKLARFLLGITFVYVGLNYFFNFLPNMPISKGGTDFIISLIKSGYLFKLVNVTQVIAGALLLLNRFVNLALCLLAPIILNIVLFHLYLDINGLFVALFLVTCYVAVLYYRRHDFMIFLKR